MGGGLEGQSPPTAKYSNNFIRFFIRFWEYLNK